MKMTVKRIMALLVTFCMILALGVGCGKGATQSVNNGSSTGESKQSVKKDSLIIATAAEPTHFFSAGPESSSNPDNPVLFNIYDNLVRLTTDGKIVPMLATSYKVSDDGLVYTFTLRDNVLFHNGEKMTAEDVAYTFNKTALTPGGKTQLLNFKSAEVVDAKTVKVVLNKPFAAFINGVAGRFAGIINKKQMEKLGMDGYGKEPVGTGPYKFVSRVSGDKVTLEAFKDYWAGVPSIKTIEIKTLSDTNTQMIAVESGGVDVVLSPPMDAVLKLKKDGPVAWASDTSSSRQTMLFSTAKGKPSSDVNFRKAIQYAVNKKEIMDGTVNGYGTIADIDMNPNYSGRPDKYTKIDFDINKAKEYLAKSNYKGEDFEVICISGSKSETIAQIMQGQLLKIGVKCKIIATDIANYNALKSKGNYGAYIFAGASSLVDADSTFMYFIKSSAGVPEMQWERLDELNDIFTKGREESNLEKRKEIYSKGVNILTDEAYEMCFYYENSTLAYNKSLKNIRPHLVNMYKYNEWSW